MTTADSAATNEVRPAELTLGEHLAELRTRLLRVVIAVAAGAVVGWFVYEPVLAFVKQPYCNLPSAYRDAQGDCSLVFLRVLEPFGVRAKIALIVGLFLTAPVLFHQVWRFVVPGLTERERRYTLPFVVLSQLMFTLGAAFAYVVIPRGLGFLIGLGGEQVTTLLSVAEYVSFILTTAVAFGLVFEVPLVLVFLAAVGIVSSTQLRRFRPYALVLNAVVAALVTPTADAVTMLFMVAPMAALYEGSILAAWLIERSRRRRATAVAEGTTR
ncbi:MAG: twin-arginine translocase subunit TatC [Actinobacteria bacterium]|nr:twin-arginine translocase subunit TatC [Actinomycetota bacterium]